MAIWGPSKIIRLDRWSRCSSGWSDSTTASVAAAAAAAAAAGVIWKRKEKSRGGWLVALNCSPLRVNPDVLQQQQTDDDSTKVLKEGEEGVGIMCEPCNGRGWLLCDFCEGQKTNVKAANSRVYRRCPNCKATGYVLCSKCKVFKCVTYPDCSDGGL